MTEAPRCLRKPKTWHQQPVPRIVSPNHSNTTIPSSVRSGLPAFPRCSIIFTARSHSIPRDYHAYSPPRAVALLSLGPQLFPCTQVYLLAYRHKDTQTHIQLPKLATKMDQTPLRKTALSCNQCKARKVRCWYHRFQFLKSTANPIKARNKMQLIRNAFAAL